MKCAWCHDDFPASAEAPLKVRHCSVCKIVVHEDCGPDGPCPSLGCQGQQELLNKLPERKPLQPVRRDDLPSARRERIEAVRLLEQEKQREEQAIQRAHSEAALLTLGSSSLIWWLVQMLAL